MRPADKQNVRITHLERLNNSVNGNPAFMVTFDDGTSHRTQSDASVSYEIQNPEFRGLVHVWLSKRGSIEYATPAERAS